MVGPTQTTMYNYAKAHQSDYNGRPADNEKSKKKSVRDGITPVPFSLSPSWNANVEFDRAIERKKDKDLVIKVFNIDEKKKAEVLDKKKEKAINKNYQKQQDTYKWTVNE